MEANLSHEIRSFARRRRISMTPQQEYQLEQKCSKKLDKAIRETTRSIIEEEVEHFMINQEDLELR